MHNGPIRARHQHPRAKTVGAGMPAATKTIASRNNSPLET